MSLTNEDLIAISQLLDDRLKPINDRLDKMDDRLDKTDSRLDVIEMKQDIATKKIDDLRLDVAISERDIRRDIHKLNDGMETVVEVLKQHELLPR
jgi:chromosome segregation ATPase